MHGATVLKRLIALFLVINLTALCLAQSGPVALAVDIPSTWAQAEIDEARAKGLVTTQADGNYHGNISRVLFCMQVVNMVETALGSTVTVSIANPFSDISNEYVTKAYQLGIVYGVSATLFNPLAYITRQEIAVMMMRSARALDLLAGKSYAAVSGMGVLSFADQDQIASWALADIQAANSLDIMKGVGENRINPTGNTTVEESILLINRLYDGFLDAPVTGAGPTTNSVPVALANPVEFSVSEQTALLIEADQLALDNNGDVLTVVAINGQQLTFATSYGTAALTSDGKISYISDDITTNVADDFVVTVSDGIDLSHINIRVNLTSSLVLIIVPTIASVGVSGNLTANSTVSAGLISYLGGIPSPAATLSYQWMSAITAGGSYSNISGATSASYVIPASSVGKYLKLKVTANGSAGGSATSVAVGPVTYGFASGDGTSVNPYRIATAEQLMLLNDIATTGKYFTLTDNMTLAAGKYITSTFYGTLYGYAHTVTLSISSSTGNYVGLFAKTGTASLIHGVVVDGTINTTHACAGGIAGQNDGTISRCISSVTVTSVNYAGGIAGLNNGTVVICEAEAAVNTGSYAGGIAGYNSGSITRCEVASGNVYAASYAGGVTGYSNSSGSIVDSSSNAAVGATSYGGGLNGLNMGMIYNCYSTGSVSGGTNLGGLVGYSSGGTVGNSYYDKNTSNRSDTGKGVPKTTAEMMTQSTYSGWDFTTRWGFTVGQYPWHR